MALHGHAAHSILYPWAGNLLTCGLMQHRALHNVLFSIHFILCQTSKLCLTAVFQAGAVCLWEAIRDTHSLF